MGRIAEPSGSLLDRIYDAASDGALWPAALTAIADLTRSQGAVLFGQSVSASTVYFEHNGRLSEECNAVYKQRHMQNPWSIYMETQPVGTIVISDMALQLPELVRMAFYDEVLRPQDVAHNAMIALAAKQDFRAAFNLCRSARQGPLGDDGKLVLAGLLPHLRRALLLMLRLEGYQALQNAQFDLLDRLAGGVVVVDRAARVVFANRAACALAVEGGPLALRDGRLAAVSPEHSRRLAFHIHAALAGAPLATMSIPHPQDGRLVAVLISAVRGRDRDRQTTHALRDPAALVFLSDPAGPLALPARWLEDAYGLTPTEARVALSIAAGGALGDTARRLGISHNTAKTHLHRIFAKTDTRRQAELARLIGSLAQVRAAP